MSSMTPLIVALDPGVTTGWATFHEDRYQSGHWEVEEVFRSMQTHQFLHTGNLTVVCESFQYRPGLPKVDLTPVEVIGVLKEWERRYGNKIVWQTPSMRKFFTDARLKNKGVYVPGQRHGNDALRHLLYYQKAFS